MFLNFLFVAVDLLLDPIDGRVYRREKFPVVILGDKIVLVLGIDFDFDLLDALVAYIDGDLNHGDAIEEMKELFGFRLDLRLMIFAEVPMTGGDFDLHSHKPPTSGWFPIPNCYEGMTPGQPRGQNRPR